MRRELLKKKDIAPDCNLRVAGSSKFPLKHILSSLATNLSPLIFVFSLISLQTSSVHVVNTALDWFCALGNGTPDFTVYKMNEKLLLQINHINTKFLLWKVTDLEHLPRSIFSQTSSRNKMNRVLISQWSLQLTLFPVQILSENPVLSLVGQI